MKFCPCGSNKTYDLCCGAFISGKKYPHTPEELMRSRYTAYTLAKINYITRTMKGPALKQFNAKEAREWARQVKWLKLEVVATETQGSVGTVEFRAYYAYGNKEQLLQERSEFHLEGKQWYYVDGKVGGKD